MSSTEKQCPFKEPMSPIQRRQSGLAELFVTPSPKKAIKVIKVAMDSSMENLSSMRGSHQAQRLQKITLNNGDHTLIPVTAKMIYSAVSECKRLVLKDS
jgi:hypothetical protein